MLKRRHKPEPAAVNAKYRLVVLRTANGAFQNRSVTADSNDYVALFKAAVLAFKLNSSDIRKNSFIFTA